jgi:hypothetical protein
MPDPNPLLTLGYDERFRVAEIPLVAARFPGFVPVRFRSGAFGFKGSLPLPSGGAQKIAIVLPRTAYGSTSYPYVPAAVYPLGWDSTMPIRHMYTDGTLCLLLPSEWSPHFTVPTVIALAVEWFANYEIFKSTGIWPGPEVH